MIREPIFGILPVKPFSAAKQRLTTILHADDRADLARAMFEDVLDALVRSRALDGVVVVTADAEAAIIALAAGASVVDETVPMGLNAALRGAVESLRHASAGMVVVPSDIPHLSSDAIECAVEAVSVPPAVALQRASDGGTNLLACRPAGVIPPQFGPGSFDAHCAFARRVGLAPRVLQCPALDLDLDRPDDLCAFLSLQTATRAHHRLSQAFNRGMMSRAMISI